MDGPITLRDCRPEDQARVRSLILDGLREHWVVLDDDLNSDLDDVAGRAPDGQKRTIVAELGGVMVGTGTLNRVDDAVSEISRVAVDGSARRTGIGRALVSELVATARRWSMRSVVLETTSSWSDVVAFYRSCGFTVTHTRTGEFGEETRFEFPL